MHRLLEKLLEDHQQSSQLLTKLSMTNNYPKSDKSSVWRESIVEFLDSLESSVEEDHHKNEEAIRKALMATDAPIHRRVEQIAEDHEAFERIFCKLKSACNDENISADELSGYIEDFINKYCDHMEAEETIFFPMAEKWLDEAQWTDVDKVWINSFDPE